MAQAVDAKSVLNARCASCHEEKAGGGLSRISEIRKTPEGWDMTLVRMDIWHGVKLSAAERGALVKHLSDAQGLAPEETAPVRYILERQPNVIEAFEDEDMMAMCARCHSFARVTLQRRDTAEWKKLNHTHLGQWPTLEYQAMARDRQWWQLANDDVAPKLGKEYPFKTAAWDAWSKRSPKNLAGKWRVVGHRPGTGGFDGMMEVTRSAEDVYSLAYDLTYADGTRVSGTGDSIVYTGYEWRGSVRLGSEITQEVYTVSADGNSISGRWFLADADEVGGRLTAKRAGGGAAILAVSPPYLRAGREGVIKVHGTGLSGDVSLGAGVEVVKTISATADSVTVIAKAADSAAGGARSVSVGGTSASDAFTVYGSIGSIMVEPGYGIARVGGGAVPPVTAQFEAVAYLNGADGKAGTDDDVRIGVMPAVWSVENFDQVAATMKDTQYAGSIQSNGMFVPAIAGPNPERPYQTNNAGNLAVKAKVSDEGQSIEGAGQLLVTVQRWNDPPIR
jgi:quinohemoprotein amine dehydrogenase